METRLRRKYREGQRYSSQKSTANRSGVARRTKLGATAKKTLPPQPKMVQVVNGATGHMRMVKL